MSWSDERKRNAKVAIAVTMVIVVAYFAAGWAQVIPPEYDVIRLLSGNEGATNTTANTGFDNEITSEVEVAGIPEFVNLTEEPSGDYALTFRVVVGTGDDFVAEITNYGTNASVYWDASSRWTVSEDGLRAVYHGRALGLYETDNTLHLHIEGDTFTVQGGIVLAFASPTSKVLQNQGVVSVRT
jgi:hypothetical protein